MCVFCTVYLFSGFRLEQIEIQFVINILKKTLIIKFTLL